MYDELGPTCAMLQSAADVGSNCTSIRLNSFRLLHKIGGVGHHVWRNLGLAAESMVQRRSPCMTGGADHAVSLPAGGSVETARVTQGTASLVGSNATVSQPVCSFDASYVSPLYTESKVTGPTPPVQAAVAFSRCDGVELEATKWNILVRGISWGVRRV
jgi:hypothetical protein